MRSFMANGTAFLTILREPGDHFVSTLNYFNVFEIANVSVRHGMEAVHEYIRNIEKYETIYKRPAAEKRYCIPDGFSVSKNLLSQCLGMPLGFPSGTPNITDNARAVRQYIKALDKEFLLVMLMEYFDESLVLLRRLMCWTIKDILFHVSNVGSYRSKAARRPQLSPDDRAAHKRWSSVDYALYSHFNKTFWNKVGLQGPDFHYEVAHFRQVQKAVTSFCLNIAKYAGSQIEFPESFWSPPFNVSSSDCQLMTAPLLPLLKKRHEELEPQYANYPKVKVKRNYQPLC
nr:hypothetical protein BaRGS_007426 [Batillaria attramentaria]